MSKTRAWMRLPTVVMLAVVMLAGCATRPTRDTPMEPAAQARAEAAQVTREQALQRQTDWSLRGRIAVSSADQGGSGRIEWRQAGAAYVIELSAPVTRQTWRLSGDATGARLEGIAGAPRQGGDPALLLREATGWDIPVEALAFWVRGARAPAAGPARLVFRADQHLARLEQGGWLIDYDQWADGPGAVALPARIEARRDAARVKLLIDGWSDGVEPGP